jgi:anthranilate synthase component I
MLSPDYTEFLRLAKQATLVPVMKSVSADLLTPVSAYLSIAGDEGTGEPNAFLLESIESGEKIGRYTFLGARPYMVLRASDGEVTLQRGKKTERFQGDPFVVLRELLREHRVAQLPGLPPFTSGAVGYFAYDAVRRLEPIPSRIVPDVEVPDCVFMFFDRVLAFDHVRHQIHIMAAADVKRESPRRAYERAVRDIRTVERKLAAGIGGKRARRKSGKRAKPLKIEAASTQNDYVSAVGRAKEYIAAGDAFQVVLSRRLEFAPGASGLEIYRALRTVNPSPYMYLLRMGEMQVLGASPEKLVKVEGRKLSYRPIAGTRPRGGDEAEDRRLEEELLSDKKERAEHVMLVDLGRNDVGRVCEYGSVEVRELMKVERFSHVMHLVSSIEGRLRQEVDAVQALAACFPAGTLTGAPKVRAMQIIEELEPVRRGVYGGSVLYADFAGNLDSCIAIRTMMLKKNRAYLQAGAGIVADSAPLEEFKECNNKAQALLRAVEIARGGA